MKRKRLLKKILDALREPAPLNNNKGPIVHDACVYHISRKDKKHSGWVTPRLNKVNMKYSQIFEQGLEPQEFYDDWKDWRDGQRRWYVDASHFKRGISDERYNSFIKPWQMASRINKKLLKELRIRRAAKAKRKNTTSV